MDEFRIGMVMLDEDENVISEVHGEWLPAPEPPVAALWQSWGEVEELIDAIAEFMVAEGYWDPDDASQEDPA